MRGWRSRTCSATSARISWNGMVLRCPARAGVLCAQSNAAVPAALGGHLERCGDCGHQRVAYNSCAGPEQVLDYVGRYTHRVAISNNRLVSMDNGKVRFRWKDYRDGNRQKTMTLAAEEFIRRFLIHVLPDGFHRIRYYGFLGNCHRARKLALCRDLLRMAPAAPSDPPSDLRDQVVALIGQSLRVCPLCHTGIMVVTGCIVQPIICLPGLDTS